MDRKKAIDIVVPILFCIIYTVYFYAVVKLIIYNNKFISTNAITLDNVTSKFIGDFLVMLFFPLILIIIYRKRLFEFKFIFQSTYLQYVLIAIYIVLFVLHRDFTLNGFYRLYFYLVIVAFGEEFIFRGYVYNRLLKHNRALAIIASGFFFGILHAILPGILAGYTITRICLSMLNQIGGGIFMGYYFIYLLEKSKSLYIPIFVHAILNYSSYSVGSIGILTGIGTWIYLFISSRKKHINIQLKDNLQE